MNTGIRHFILRLAVGLLAFLLGVAAAWAITGLNPFQGSSGTRSYKKRCGSHRSWSAPPAESYENTTATDTGIRVYEGRSCKTKRMFGTVPPPPPPPAAPAYTRGS
ncbi:MAG TPA: hypothetical protein VD861_13630 [Pyrinomonadaceae bacterium]|nr:hypothetical protein [Pyrinomonadaceae bacterium]